MSNSGVDHVTRFPASDPSKAENFKTGINNSGLAIDSGGQGACATAGASIGVVIATSGNARICEGACTTVTSVALSTTLPLVQLHLGK